MAKLKKRESIDLDESWNLSQATIVPSCWLCDIVYEITATSGADSIHAQIMFRIVPRLTDLEPLIKPDPISVPFAA